MSPTTRNGRELDVNALLNSKSKVTLGFKCEAQTKMDLAFEAERFGMTLSEYVEILVLRRHQNNSDSENLTKIENLTNTLRIYENETLKAIFNKYKGKALPYRDSNGFEKEATIENLPDVYNYLLNAIKI